MKKLLFTLISTVALSLALCQGYNAFGAFSSDVFSPTFVIIDSTSTSITFNWTARDDLDSIVFVMSQTADDSVGGADDTDLEFAATETASACTVTGLRPYREYHIITRLDSSATKGYSHRDTVRAESVALLPEIKDDTQWLYNYQSWPEDFTYIINNTVDDDADTDSTLVFNVKPLMGLEIIQTQINDSLDVDFAVFGGTCDKDSLFHVSSVQTFTQTDTDDVITLYFPVGTQHGYIVLTGGTDNGWMNKVRMKLTSIDPWE